MLGALSIGRGEEVRPLPSSRKVRALLAYLALSPQAVPRERLCELFWDVPNDPRGELRWALSKLRGLLDEAGRRRVLTAGDTVALDLEGCDVDALAVLRAETTGLETVPAQQLEALVDSFRGDFLEGLALERCPEFTNWALAHRHRFRGLRIAILAELVRRGNKAEGRAHLEEWLRLSPFDPRAHGRHFATLIRSGRIHEADEHRAAALRHFKAEGLDGSVINEVWAAARHQGAAIPATEVFEAASGERATASGPEPGRRASIAVVPFDDPSSNGEKSGGPGDALAHDIITRLAKLRSPFVIGQGTMFALSERRIAPLEAGRLLDVDFLVMGSLTRRGARLSVSVELCEAPTGRLVWSETFERARSDALLVLDEIGDSIVAALSHEIEAVESARAVLRSPESLDAWGAHHRGLWHMYRFNQLANQQAQHFFRRAVELDPTFSRAHSALSFTHFQNAFQGWGERGSEIEMSFAAAGESLMADEHDPAAHWAMGRALWLRGAHQQGLDELEQAVALSPNFALGHYTLAFVHSQAGDPAVAISESDHSHRLSPFDPMLFGMFGARAMALIRLGRFDEACEWGIRAAARPNAHLHIHAIAAVALMLAGRREEARAALATIRKAKPGYSIADFLTAMQFDEAGERLVRTAAVAIGMD